MMRRLALSAVLLSLAILPAMGGDALAATCTFVGSPSPAWTNVANWTGCGGAAPGAADDAIVPALKTVYVTNSQAVGSLSLAGDVQMFNAANLNVAGTLTVAPTTSTTVQGSGTITSGGTFVKQDVGTLTIAPGITLALLAPWSQTGGTINVDATSPTAFGQITGGATGTISGGALVVTGKVTSSLVLTTPAIVLGTGTIVGTLTNTSGTVRPGPASSSVSGKLTVTGSFSQGHTGTLELTLTNPTSYDVLAVSGDASLDGNVSVSNTPANVQTTDEFRFLTAGTPLTGPGFSAISGSPAPVGTYQLDYQLPDGANAARLLLAPPITPVLTPFTGPTITPSGALDPGATLTCTPGTWTGNPKFTYSWLRDGTPIAGQSGTTYVVTLDDGLKHLACRVTATATGAIVPADSPALVAEGFIPVNTALPTTTPIAAPGDTATCSPGTWTAAPPPTFTYLWLRDGYVIVGETGTSYTVTLTDVGTDISCLVNADNSAGSKAAESKKVRIAPVIPANTALPKLTGAGKLGATLSCASGTWTGTPTGTLTYEWLRAGQPIDGETQPTYTLDFADGNRAVACRVTSTNLAGSTPAVSAPVKVEKNVEQRFNSLGFDKIATGIGMPAAKGCLRAKPITITMRAPSGLAFKSIVTNVAARRNHTTKSGSRFTTTFNVRTLKNRKLKKFTVSVTIRTTTPITIHAKRVYKIC